MSGASIKVDDADIRAALGRVIEAGRDLQPFFDHLGPGQVSATQNRFLSESDPQGRKWKELRPATIRAKRGDRRILRRRSILFGSFSHLAAPSYLAWGTNVPYAWVHQGGAVIEQYARSQKATFRTAAKGAASKTDAEGNVTRVGSRLRFAKHRTKAKSAYSKPVTIGAHSVTIPARAYLGISADDKQLIIDEAKNYLGDAWDGKSGGAA